MSRSQENTLSCLSWLRKQQPRCRVALIDGLISGRLEMTEQKELQLVVVDSLHVAPFVLSEKTVESIEWVDNTTLRVVDLSEEQFTLEIWVVLERPSPA